MKQSNKAIMRNIVSIVTQQFEVKASGCLQLIAGEVFVTLTVYNKPKSHLEEINDFIKQCEFELDVDIQSRNTETHLELINQKCEELGYPHHMTFSSIAGKGKVKTYLLQHQDHANELIHSSTRPTVVITPRYNPTQQQLQTV